MSDSVKEFYDEFAEQQQSHGVNRRHHSIMGWLKKFGLQPDHEVLEIGCGIGTLTGLLCEYVSTGKVHAVDISPKSIEIAKQQLANHKHLSLQAVDICESPIPGSFDRIVLPDVIEHIPIDLHPTLFKHCFEALKDNGVVIIHIPEPYYLEHVRADESLRTKMQIVDQSIYAHQLANDTYNAGFMIQHLESYALHETPFDYQVIALRKRQNLNFAPVQRSGWRQRLKHLLG